MTYSGGRLTITNYTIDMLIQTAYELKQYQIVGLPSWASSERYDVSATADGSPPNAEVPQMLRRLLEDRFGLKTHNEFKTQDIYELNVAKTGSKLAVSDSDTETSWKFRRDGAIEAQAVSMAWFVQTLARQLQRSVVDKTGLTGRYTFTLQWDEGAGLADGSEQRPSLFGAVQEQLGLRLTGAKGRAEVLVLDHLARPSQN